MSPQLGQGANLAFWDAAALADALTAAENVDAALRRYERGRRAHVRFYQFMSRWLTPVFQSDSRWLGLLRDRVLATACRFGPLHRRMLRTMCGIERGILRAPLPLEPLRAALTDAGTTL